MAKFSVHEDDEGPSNRVPKKRKISCRHTSSVEACIVERSEPEVVVAQEEEEDEEDEEEEEEEGEEEGEEEEEGDEEEEEEEYEEEEQIEAWREPLSKRNASSLESARDGSITVTLTDPEVLDCSICCEPLAAPVFQCENGHIACSSCCTKILNRCPCCCTPIGYNRCRAIEKVLESIKVSCQNRIYGCQESFIYSTKHNHGKVCTHAPCSCPLSDCSFVGSWNMLSQHITYKHYASATRFKYCRPIIFKLDANERFKIFQEEFDGSLFILNNRKELLGNLVTASRIGPPTRGSYYYELSAKALKTSLKLQSFTNCIQRWVDGPPSVYFLLIPSPLFNPSEGLRLELCISSYGMYPMSFNRPCDG